MKTKCTQNEVVTNMKSANMKQWLPAFVILLWILFAAAVFFPTHAQSQPNPLFSLRYNRALNIAYANETWAGKWFVTSTALTFPDGGKAGFYRRITRSGRAVPYKGRQGVLYLYPETRYRPARISKHHIDITQGTSSLVLGVSANRNPNGKWLLRVIIDKEQLGEDVVVSGKDGWQDIAFNLSGFLGRMVDIDIEAHASNNRAAHVYIDYIHMENPAGRPVRFSRFSALTARSSPLALCRHPRTCSAQAPNFSKSVVTTTS
jgi:hypothetical protein